MKEIEINQFQLNILLDEKQKEDFEFLNFISQLQSFIPIEKCFGYPFFKFI